jgi:hypothetical protein
MQKLIKILKSVLIVAFLVSFSATESGCAAKKNPWTKKKSQASKVNSSQLGRNKYFFSTNYQKKLQKSYKKK